MALPKISLQDSNIISLKALDVLNKHKNGVRFVEFVELVHKELPKYSRNNVYYQVWRLPKKYPDKVYLPEKGIYQLIKHAKYPRSKKQLLKNEEDYYQFFVEYLTELENCVAEPIGRNKIGKIKWTNPDVLGVKRTDENDTIQATLEIVSAEIKKESDFNELITGFGQACSYKLFSHKSYLVVPKFEKELQRLDSLCGMFGIGFVLFNVTKKGKLEFELRHRAIRSEPDNFFIAQHDTLKIFIRQLIDKSN